MNLQNKYITFCAFLFIIVPITMSTMTGKISSTDYVYRHSVWINQYLSGNFTALTFYPPMFHIIMMPFVIGKFPIQYFQVIFAIIATFCSLYFIGKIEGEKTVSYLAVMLASSIAYVEFAGSLMPQALDYAFFPILLLFYYRENYRETIAAIVLFMSFHVTAFLFCLIILIHAILTKRHRMAKYLLITSLILLPFFFYYSFVVKYMEYDFAGQSAWEKQYIWPPYNFFFFSGFITWVLLFYAIRNLYKSKKLTDSQKLYLIWIAVFFSVGIFQQGIWRMISYQIMPLSMFVASVVSDGINNVKEANAQEKIHA